MELETDEADAQGQWRRPEGKKRANYLDFRYPSTAPVDVGSQRRVQ
jgi:hypothetical protein